MADLTIESIAIEITTSVEKADKALEKLEKNLLILKAACTGGLEGAESFAKGVKQIAEASKGFNSVDGDKIKNAASALRSLKSIGDIGNLSNAAHQMKNLQKISDTVAAMPEIDKTKISRIRAFGNAFKSLSQIEKIPDLSKLANSLQPLVSATNALNQADMSNFAANMQQLAAGMQPLSGMQNHNFSSVVRGLERLPSISKSLSHMNFGTFARQMQQVATAIQPLSRQMRSLSSSFSRLPAPVQQAVTSMMNYNTSVQNATTRTSGFGKSLKLLNFTAMYFAVKRVVNILGQFITSSNEYVENLNLFTVTMGEAADEALKFANTVNEAMGIDVSQWIQNQGVFKQMTSGFGMVEEKANLVSKNLTQLGYDISSYYNISVESAMQKLQSGMAGEIMPLRSLGYALDEAMIKQVALNHGITENVTNMSQAQKAQLRYIAIMEQSTNAMGDMARTIESPANQIRILESRIQTLKRAIGDSLMPVVSAALPYVTAFVQIVGEAFRNLAEFMGFELPKFDYSDLITKDNKAVADSFDEATAASKAFKGTLSSIDQLNIIGSKSETSTGTGNNLGADLNLELLSYDFLGNLKNETSEAYNTLKDFWKRIQPIVTGAAAAIAAIFAVKGATNFINTIKDIGSAFNSLKSSNLAKVTSGIMAGVTAFLQFRNVVKDLTKGNGSLVALIGSIGAVVVAVGAFIALKNPLGAALTLIGAGLGAIAGYVDGIKEKAEEDAMAKITASFERGVTPISDVADALERVAGDLTSSEQDYLNRKESLKSISDNAKTVGDNINTMISELKGMETVSPEVTENLKTAFEELATASKKYIEESNNNFKLYILANQDMLKAQGFNVSSMVEIINQGTQNAEESIESLQARAKELSDQQFSVGLNTDELAELETINMQLLEMSGVDIDFGVDIKGVTDVLENIASIKFKDADTAAQNMEKAFSVAADAYSTLYTAKEEMMKDIDRLELFGDLDDSQIEMLRNAIEFIFDVEETALDETFSKPLNSIIAQAEILDSSTKANIALATAKGFDAAANTGFGALLNEDFRANYFSGKDIETINREKYQETVGDAAPYLEDTINRLYSAFAQRGLGKDVVDRMRENGKNVVQGAADGIEENSAVAVNAIKAVADETERAWRDETKTHSPSEVYTELGGYVPDGLAIGILNGKPKVLSAIDEIAKAMRERMSGLQIEMPTYSEEDVSKSLNATWRGSFGSMQGTAQAPQYQGADRQAMTDAGNAYAQNGIPINVEIALQSYVELDGEQVGQAAAQYQQQQMAYSNGY